MNEKNDARLENPSGSTDADPRDDERGATNGPRYCPMCDKFMSARECKACGMPTEKASKL